jgi:apolipoprotein N-acyltransferase
LILEGKTAQRANSAFLLVLLFMGFLLMILFWSESSTRQGVLLVVLYWLTTTILFLVGALVLVSARRISEIHRHINMARSLYVKNLREERRVVAGPQSGGAGEI